MSLLNKVVTWRCPGRLSAVVEVLQSCPKLLEYLVNGKSVSDAQRPPSAHRRLLILFPGNPGIVQFYEQFCALADAQRIDVLVMGLAGHSLVDLNQGRLFTLQDQVDIADQFTTIVLNETSTLKYGGSIYVAGHSIGGFIAMHMLARHKSIKKYFGLCPVISRIAESPNGRGMFFWNVPVLQWIAAYLGSCFALLPEKLRRWVVDRHGPTVDVPLRELLAKYMHRAALMNAFYMSMTEFCIVGRPDKLLLHSIQEKMVMYYVLGDMWAPPQFAEEIRDLCPRLGKYIMEEDSHVPHAWCLQHNSRVLENVILKNL